MLDNFALVCVVDQIEECIWCIHSSLHFLGDEEALEDGQAREVKQRDEEGCHNPGDQQHEESRHKWLLDSHTSRHSVGVGHGHCDVGAQTHDHSFANGSHQPTGNRCGEIGTWISSEHPKSLFSTVAEGETSDGNLHISILTDKLDALIKAPDAVTDTSKGSFGHWVFTCNFFLLLGKEFENDFEHGDDGDEHATKC